MSGRCSIRDCARPIYAHGWCNLHYQRWRKHGDPAIKHSPTARKPGRKPLTRDELLVLIAERTISHGPDECWPWTGATGGPQRRPQIAHQYVTRILLGLVPGDRLQARHTCDNPCCVNPSHLVVGTAHDNHRDMVERGRSAQDERHWNWKGGRSRNYREARNRMPL